MKDEQNYEKKKYISKGRVRKDKNKKLRVLRESEEKVLSEGRWRMDE